MSDAGGGGQSYAQTGAGDISDDTGDVNAFEFGVERILNRRSSATIVKIVKPPYDANGNPIPPGTPGPIGFVDVLPLINQIDGYGNATPHGTVYRLSYHRYQSGAGAFISDPAMGDVGTMVVDDRDTSSVRANGGQQANPGSRRKGDMADGVFHGCSIAGSPSQYVAFGADGFVIADKHGNMITSDASGVKINGILFAQGTAGTFREHTHAQPDDSNGDTEKETNHPTPGT